MIRKFRDEDIDEVMELWFAGNVQAHYFIPSEYWENNYEVVKNMLPQANLSVCEKEKQILGFIGLQENYIAGIFVKAASQSKGIGRQLLDSVKQDRTHLTLHVYKKNERGIRFYRREGFWIQEEQVEESTGEVEFKMVWERYNEGRN